MDTSASLADLTKMFESRMHSYEERLRIAATPETPSSPEIAKLSSEFADFKVFIWDILSTLKKHMELLALGHDRQETFLRRKVLLLHGVPESKDENAHLVVSHILSDQMKLSEVTPDDFEACHRLGSNSSKPRPLLLRFNVVQRRRLVWDNKSSLKGSGYTLSEFLTRPRHLLFMAARNHFGMSRCWSAEGKVHILLPDKSRRKVEQTSELEALIAKYPEQQVDSQRIPASEKSKQSDRKNPALISKPNPKPARFTRSQKQV